MQALSSELNKELKPKKSPKAQIQAQVQISIVKSANTQGLKLQLLKEEGRDRLLLNPSCLQDNPKDKRRRV